MVHYKGNLIIGFNYDKKPPMKVRWSNAAAAALNEHRFSMTNEGYFDDDWNIAFHIIYDMMEKTAKAKNYKQFAAGKRYE